MWSMHGLDFAVLVPVHDDTVGWSSGTGCVDDDMPWLPVFTDYHALLIHHITCTLPTCSSVHSHCVWFQLYCQRVSRNLKMCCLFCSHIPPPHHSFNLCQVFFVSLFAFFSFLIYLSFLKARFVNVGYYVNDRNYNGQRHCLGVQALIIDLCKVIVKKSTFFNPCLTATFSGVH